MVSIVDIEWLSKQAKEAIVTLTDGNFFIRCFCHPFEDSYISKIPLPVYAFGPQDIYKVENELKNCVIKGESSFDYELTGRIVNDKEGIIKIGKILISLDLPLPGDVFNGDFISFKCDRVDIY